MLFSVPFERPEPDRLWSLTWSPDGQSIAFIRQEVGNRYGYGRRPKLWIIDADGSDAHEISNVGTAQSVTWLPDGRVAYVGLTQKHGERVPTRFVPSLDGGRVRPLGIPGSVSHPVWSEDGSQAAYFDLIDQDRYRLVVRDLKEGSERRVTGAPREFFDGGEPFDWVPCP